MQGGGIAVINGKKGDGRGSAGVIVSGNGTRSRTMHSLAFFLLGEVYRRGHTTKPIILSVLLQSPTLSCSVFYCFMHSISRVCTLFNPRSPFESHCQCLFKLRNSLTTPMVCILFYQFFENSLFRLLLSIFSYCSFTVDVILSFYFARRNWNSDR